MRDSPHAPNPGIFDAEIGKPGSGSVPFVFKIEGQLPRADEVCGIVQAVLSDNITGPKWDGVNVVLKHRKTGKPALQTDKNGVLTIACPPGMTAETFTREVKAFFPPQRREVALPEARNLRLERIRGLHRGNEVSTVAPTREIADLEDKVNSLAGELKANPVEKWRKVFKPLVAAFTDLSRKLQIGGVPQVLRLSIPQTFDEAMPCVINFLNEVDLGVLEAVDVAEGLDAMKRSLIELNDKRILNSEHHVTNLENAAKTLRVTERIGAPWLLEGAPVDAALNELLDAAEELAKCDMNPGNDSPPATSIARLGTAVLQFCLCDNEVARVSCGIQFRDYSEKNNVSKACLLRYCKMLAACAETNVFPGEWQKYAPKVATTMLMAASKFLVRRTELAVAEGNEGILEGCKEIDVRIEKILKKDVFAPYAAEENYRFPGQKYECLSALSRWLKIKDLPDTSFAELEEAGVAYLAALTDEVRAPNLQKAAFENNLVVTKRHIVSAGICGALLSSFDQDLVDVTDADIDRALSAADAWAKSKSTALYADEIEGWGRGILAAQHLDFRLNRDFAKILKFATEGRLEEAETVLQQIPAAFTRGPQPAGSFADSVREHIAIYCTGNVEAIQPLLAASIEQAITEKKPVKAADILTRVHRWPALLESTVAQAPYSKMAADLSKEFVFKVNEDMVKAVDALENQSFADGLEFLEKYKALRTQFAIELGESPDHHEKAVKKVALVRVTAELKNQSTKLDGQDLLAGCKAALVVLKDVESLIGNPLFASAHDMVLQLVNSRVRIVVSKAKNSLTANPMGFDAALTLYSELHEVRKALGEKNLADIDAALAKRLATQHTEAVHAKFSAIKNPEGLVAQLSSLQDNPSPKMKDHPLEKDLRAELETQSATRLPTSYLHFIQVFTRAIQTATTPAQVAEMYKNFEDTVPLAGKVFGKSGDLTKDTEALAQLAASRWYALTSGGVGVPNIKTAAALEIAIRKSLPALPKALSEGVLKILQQTAATFTNELKHKADTALDELQKSLCPHDKLLDKVSLTEPGEKFRNAVDNAFQVIDTIAAIKKMIPAAHVEQLPWLKDIAESTGKVRERIKEILMQVERALPLLIQHGYMEIQKLNLVCVEGLQGLEINPDSNFRVATPDFENNTLKPLLSAIEKECIRVRCIADTLDGSVPEVDLVRESLRVFCETIIVFVGNIDTKESELIPDAILWEISPSDAEKSGE